MKRYFTALLIFFLALSLGGCGTTWGQKFTRRKKEAKPQPKIYQMKKYPKKPSADLYKQHYSYWSTWQMELLSRLGENHKKDVQCIEEIISNLRDMQNILIPEWGEKLQRQVDRIMEAREIIVYGELSKYNKDTIMHDLEKVDRDVKRDFCYSKVKSFLKKDMNEDAMAAEGTDAQPEASVEVKDEPKTEAAH